MSAKGPSEEEIDGWRQITVALDSAENILEEMEILSTGYQRIAKERAIGSFVGGSTRDYVLYLLNLVLASQGILFRW